MKEKEFYLAVGVKSFEDDKLSVCSNALLNSDAIARKPGCQLVTKVIVDHQEDKVGGGGHRSGRIDGRKDFLVDDDDVDQGEVKVDIELIICWVEKIFKLMLTKRSKLRLRGH